LLPEIEGDLKRVKIETLPECDFIAGLMQLAMVAAAERHRKLVTDFAAQGAELGKSDVVRI
jgi:hypothetical protein